MYITLFNLRAAFIGRSFLIMKFSYASIGYPLFSPAGHGTPGHFDFRYNKNAERQSIKRRNSNAKFNSADPAKAHR